MGSGGASQSQQSSMPWIEQQPFLKNIYANAQRLFGQGPYQYGPQAVAGFDPAQMAGQQQASQRATEGSPLLRSAQNQLQSTLQGDYLSPDSNPWLSDTFDAASRGVSRNFMQTVMPTLNTRFGMGRTQQDSGLNAQTAAAGRAQDVLGTNLKDLATGIYGGNYARERGMQGQAGQMARSLAEADYTDSSMLRGIGQERQTQSQRYLDDLRAQFDFGQHADAQRLAEYSSFIGAPVQTSRGSSSAMNMSLLWG